MMLAVLWRSGPSTQHLRSLPAEGTGTGSGSWHVWALSPSESRDRGPAMTDCIISHMCLLQGPRPTPCPCSSSCTSWPPPPSSPSPPLPSHVRQDRGPTQGCRSSERWPTTPGRVVFTKPFSEMKQVLRRGLLYLIQPTYYLPPTWVVTKRTSRKR